MAAWVLTVRLGDGDDAEQLSSRLWSLGATGIAETAERQGGRTLIAGFVAGMAARRAEAALDHAGAAASPVDPLAWVDSWRRTATTTRVGGLVVRAPWHPQDPHAVTEVVIDPGPTFGHGGHPTTRLVLGELPRLVGPGRSVLDVGCGSGVLAIAAAALGASHVVAVDTDPDAVEATRANAAANGTPVEVVAGTVTAELGRFDVVLANLLAPVLRRLAPSLAGAVAAGGRVVVAGLLADQRPGVEAALHPLVTTAAGRDGDWVLLELERPGPASAPGGAGTPGPRDRLEPGHARGAVEER